MHSSFVSTVVVAAVAALVAPCAAAPHSRHQARNVSVSADSYKVDQHLPTAVKTNPRHADKALIQSLLLAPTQKDRMNLLNQPGDGVFDFTNPPSDAVTQGNGGHTVAAHAGNFPALIGNGAAMTLGFLGPCGINTPHVHNRATELNIPVRGRLVSTFIEENGVAARQDLLNTFTMTVFPEGAVHGEFNPDCEEAVFVAGFSSADPGVGQIAQSFFGLRSDVVGATLGGVSTLNGEDIESFKEVLPANVVLGVESCLKKCGIKKNAKRDISEVLAGSA